MDRGHVADIKPDGWGWGLDERLPQFWVIKIPGATVDECWGYLDAITDANGEITNLRGKNLDYNSLSTPLKRALDNDGYLVVTKSQADAYIKKYFERFPGIRDYMETSKAFARANGYVKTIFGRRIWVAGIKSKNPQERAFAERQSINAPLQGAAADIIRRAMIRLPDEIAASGLKARMLLQVHDELVFESPAEEADRLCKLAKQVMEAAPSPAAVLSVPLTVAVSFEIIYHIISC